MELYFLLSHFILHMYLLNSCTFSLNIEICSFPSCVRSMKFGTDFVMCAKKLTSFEIVIITMKNKMLFIFH